MKVVFCTVPRNRGKHVSGGRATSIPARWEAVQPRGDQFGQAALDLVGFSALAVLAHSSPAQWVHAPDLWQGPALPLGTA